MTEEDFFRSVSKTNEHRANILAHEAAEARESLIAHAFDLIKAAYEYDNDIDNVTNYLFTQTHVPAEGMGNDAYSENSVLSIRLESHIKDIDGSPDESLIIYMPISQKFSEINNLSDDPEEKNEILAQEEPCSIIIQVLTSHDSIDAAQILKITLGGVVNYNLYSSSEQEIGAALDNFIDNVLPREEVDELIHGNPAPHWPHTLPTSDEKAKLTKLERSLVSFELVPQKIIKPLN
jgi:hypothetical protein